MMNREKVRVPMAYNRAYVASVLHTFAQIQPNGWTSDTPITLSVIRLKINIFQIKLGR